MQALILYLLCHLISVDGALVMTASNTTVEVTKSVDKLGAKSKMKKVDSISISCKMRDDSSRQLKAPDISWQRLGSSDSRQPDVSGKASDNGKSFESKLTFKYPKNDNVAAYRCTGRSGGVNVSAVAAFQSSPLIDVGLTGGGIPDQRSASSQSFHPDVVVYPDLELTATCLAAGYPGSSFGWFRETPEGKEAPTGNGSKLSFGRLSYAKHRGHYICRAENALGKNAYRLHLRVQHPRAYLVPLIALIVQVVIIVAVGVLYEFGERRKRRQRGQRQEMTRDSVG